MHEALSIAVFSGTTQVLELVEPEDLGSEPLLAQRSVT